MGEVRVRGWSVVEVEVWESLRNAEKNGGAGKKCSLREPRRFRYMFGMMAGLGWWLAWELRWGKGETEMTVVKDDVVQQGKGVGGKG